MKRFALGAVALLMAQGAMASSYVTGNVQFHSDGGSDATSTLEAGHTFTNSLGGLTLLTEFDGIQLGEINVDDKGNKLQDSTYVTLGAEQAMNITDNLWVAAGYHHLIQEGETIQYRPLVKIGYNMDNISLYHRSRYHIDATDGDTAGDSLRTDTSIAYQLNEDVNLKYNFIYNFNDDANNGESRKNSKDHELRATWTRNGVQPYFEYRNQANNSNNAFVFGASYGF